MTDRIDWTRAPAPSLEDLDALAEAAFAALPQEFRALCDGLVIKVEDFPTDEVMTQMRCETEFDLLGLFVGRGLAQAGATPLTGEQPNMIWLYRRPILDYWAEHEEELGALVTHVLVHEIGHHFGFSDEDMDEIERRAG
ncbi:MAG TPA: metallopeptidase family protein [Beijerinckiaceae bacterium]|jgi:predicted Zn-dependent protease with MMP-like domain